MNRNPPRLGISPLLLFSCLLLLASPGFAQDDEAAEGPGRPGWYLAAGGSFVLTNYRSVPEGAADTFGFNGRVGYRANRYAAMEAEFEWLHPFGLEAPAGGTQFRSYAIGINGKFFLTDAVIQPYAILGVGGLITTTISGLSDVRRSDWGFRGGAGADYYLTPNIVLNVEATYMWGVGDVWESDYASFGAGLMYRF